MKFTNLEEAIQFLINRGKSIIRGDKVSVTHDGYKPDVEAYDEYGRLMCIVVDDTKDANDERLNALKEFVALDNRMSLIVIEAPSFMRPDKVKKVAGFPGGRPRRFKG